MHRRSRAAVLLATITLLPGCATQQAPELIEHPNVLFISLDDMNDWVEPLAGHPQALTPQLERFASSGVTFNRNYAPSPGCNPSRSVSIPWNLKRSESVTGPLTTAAICCRS